MKPFHSYQCPKTFSVAGDLNNLKKTINEYFVQSISFFCSDDCLVKNIRQMTCTKMLKSFIRYSWRHNSSICKTIIFSLSMKKFKRSFKTLPDFIQTFVIQLLQVDTYVNVNVSKPYFLRVFMFVNIYSARISRM